MFSSMPTTTHDILSGSDDGQLQRQQLEVRLGLRLVGNISDNSSSSAEKMEWHNACTEPLEVHSMLANIDARLETLERMFACSNSSMSKLNSQKDQIYRLCSRDEGFQEEPHHTSRSSSRTYRASEDANGSMQRSQSAPDISEKDVCDLGCLVDEGPRDPIDVCLRRGQSNAAHKKQDDAAAVWKGSDMRSEKLADTAAVFHAQFSDLETSVASLSSDVRSIKYDQTMLGFRITSTAEYVEEVEEAVQAIQMELPLLRDFIQDTLPEDLGSPRVRNLLAEFQAVRQEEDENGEGSKVESNASDDNPLNDIGDASVMSIDLEFPSLSADHTDNSINLLLQAFPGRTTPAASSDRRFTIPSLNLRLGGGDRPLSAIEARSLSPNQPNCTSFSITQITLRCGILNASWLVSNNSLQAVVGVVYHEYARCFGTLLGAREHMGGSSRCCSSELIPSSGWPGRFSDPTKLT